MALLEVWALALLCTSMATAQTETTSAPSAGPTSGQPAEVTGGPTDKPSRWGRRFLNRGPPPEFAGVPPPPGSEGPGKSFMDELLARLYPKGAPVEVTDLLSQRTPQSFRQAMDIVRQAAETQGIQIPGPFRCPPGAGGPGPFPAPPGPLMDGLLARVYPIGVPAEVTDLMAQGTPESLGQAMDIVRQAVEVQGIQLPGSFPRPPGAGGPRGGFGRGFFEGGLLSRVYPEGVPAEVTNLIAQGTPEASRQIMQLVGQAVRDRIAQRLAGSGLTGGGDATGNGFQGGPFQGGFPRPQLQRAGLAGGNAGSLRTMGTVSCAE